MRGALHGSQEICLKNTYPSLPPGGGLFGLGAAAPWGLNQVLAPDRLSTSLTLLLLLTALSLAPALVVMVTSFTRLVVVFAFLRQALGTQQMPPSQVLIALSLFLTVFIMSPVWQDIQAKAVQPYIDQKLTGEEALQRGLQPLKTFMFKQTREKDLALFLSIMKSPRPKNLQDTPIAAVVPAFMISELRTAFEIGFLLFLPFFIIDLVVASVLLSMGMMMLPPVMISLVFKVLLLVLVDGWNLLVGSLIRSFHLG
ncbi:MAG: flagellar type III secretion system pore protein FliP [Syntrophobacterales bacterium]